MAGTATMVARMERVGPRDLSDGERLDWLRLIRTENVGPLTFHRLLVRYGSAAAALEALPELVRRGGRPQGMWLYSRQAAERELAAVDRAGARLVGCCEKDYPPLLAHIEDAPPLICMVGEPRILRRTLIAVVGTRNASINGRRLASSLAADFGAAGSIVVSGLARGIDTAAHGAALQTGTVAVVAGGVDVVYPPENRKLHDEIAERGVVVSEMPLGLQPQGRHFPRRNRLISGLSRGVVVVEAALRSGSLITARFALEQGREVFAVPGSPLDPRARGANDLIRQGASLTESAADVLRALGEQQGRVVRPRLSQPPLEVDLTRPDTVSAAGAASAPAAAPDSSAVSQLAAARMAIAQALSPAPATVDEIIRSCQLSHAVVTTVLLEWELAGRLERQAGNRVALVA